LILSFRIALFIFGIFFTYYFGETMEKFVLEVVRFFISIDSSNALAFNAAHLIVLISPLLFLAVIISLSLSDERLFRRRFLLVLGGMGIGIIAFRIVQIWWIFRGGGFQMGGEINSWSESLTPAQAYFWEKVFPFILVGAASGVAPAIGESDSKNIVMCSAVSSLSAILWLFVTRKIQNLEGASQVSCALISVCACGAAAGLVIKKIREF
jgi:hypothetical protein